MVKAVEFRASRVVYVRVIPIFGSESANNTSF
jgi:hypothetical protein